MFERHHHRLQEINRALRCPTCGYCLDGLQGDDVHCPECGMHLSLTALVVAAWKGPWFRAPRFNVLVYPAAWLLLVGIVSVFLGPAIRGFGARLLPWQMTGGVAMVAVIWIGLLAVSRIAFGDIRAVWLALLAHVLIVAYLVGAVGLVSSCVQVFFFAQQADTLAVILRVVMAVAFVLVMFLARAGERFIAAQCVRRELISRVSL